VTSSVIAAIAPKIELAEMKRSAQKTEICRHTIIICGDRR